MVIFVNTSGAIYAAGSSEQNGQGCFKFVLTVPVLVATDHHLMLGTTTTVNQLIKLPTVMLSTHSFLMIHSGMVNSVTMGAHAALAPTLHHGSVWI